MIVCVLRSLIINEMGHIKSRTYKIASEKCLCQDQYIRHLFYHKTPRIQTSKRQSAHAVKPMIRLLPPLS